MSSSRVLCCLPSVKKRKHDFYFFRSMYYKTIIRFGFCDIQNKKASADNLYLDLDYSGYDKTSSNNCLSSCTLPCQVRCSGINIDENDTFLAVGLTLSFFIQDDVEVVYEKLNERVQDLRYESSSRGNIFVTR